MKKKFIIISVALLIIVIVAYGLLKKPLVPYFVQTVIKHLLKDNSSFPADVITGHVNEDENQIYKHVDTINHDNAIDMASLNPQLPDKDENTIVVSGDSLLSSETKLPPMEIDQDTRHKLAMENKNDIKGDISESEIYHGKRIRVVKKTHSKKPQQAKNPQPKLRTLKDIQQQNKDLMKSSTGSSDTTTIKPLAILIDSMGANATITKQIIDMKYNLNLSFIPYAKHVKYQVAYAKKRHKTIVVQMSMQPLNAKIKLNPHTLLITDSKSQLTKKIAWNLSQFQGYSAVTTHMGSRFVKDKAGLNILMSELKKKKVSFIDALSTITSQAYKVSIKHQIPTLKRNIFVNNNQSYKRTLQSFAKITHMANKYGYTFAIVYPSPTTIKALKIWLKQINKDKHYKLVTINQLIHHVYNKHPSHISKILIQ